MCIICVSKKGVKQPSKELLRRMFRENPHGAGFMVAEKGKVRISKGYMDFESFYDAVSAERFGKNDAVVYHFRISTQAGVQPSMTQPFPLVKNIKNTRVLDCIADLGIAHNGIIRFTSDPNDHVYSDTAHFISEYLADWIRNPGDFTDEFLDALAEGTKSRFAFLDGSGTVYTSGDYIEDYNGLLFSNESYLGFRRKVKKFNTERFWKSA